MKKILLLVFLCFFIHSGHPFYMSVTDLKYNADERALQGYIKIFTNDLEAALKKIENRTVDLIHPKDSSTTKDMLTRYLGSRLHISVNGVPGKFELLGFENEQEAIWIYIQMNNCPYPKEVSITNTILYDFIKEQSNIVHLEVNGPKKSLKVTFPDKRLDFVF